MTTAMDLKQWLEVGFPLFTQTAYGACVFKHVRVDTQVHMCACVCVYVEAKG